ncbi:hypothetical protein TYRP_005352 [Tyrophagus putrescentiae]|nr:hypothetical protein TYRP_005352 [Tyrophagus putrescentiae]
MTLMMISFSHLPLPSPLVLLQCVDEGRLDEDVEGDADEERAKDNGKQVKRQRPAVGQRYQRPPSAQRHPDHPGVRQVEGVAGAGDGPEGGPGEERTEVAAVSGGTQPDGAGEGHRPEDSVQRKEHGRKKVPLNVRVGAVQAEEVGSGAADPQQKSLKEGDTKKEANEEDAAVIPRLVEKGDKGTGHAVFGEKVAANILFRGNNVPRWKPSGKDLNTADHRTGANQQHRHQLTEFSILQVQQIEPPVGLTGVHQGTDIGGPEGPIESGGTCTIAGPSNQAHAEQKEKRQLRRQPGPAKCEEFKVAKSPVLTGGVLEGDDGDIERGPLECVCGDDPQQCDGSQASPILFRHWSYSPRSVSVPEAIPAGGRRPQELNIFTAHVRRVLRAVSY